MDFTLKTYRQLLLAFQQAKYTFLRYEDYCVQKEQLPKRFVILRHDVDLKAENSLAMAKLESNLGIMATYYFRVLPQSNKPKLIKDIAELGHEIGYHYEDLAICKGDLKKSIGHFQKKIAYFREFYPVETICMHGAPRSKFDSRDLWKSYDYHDFGIIGEPYFDTDFSKILYLTDTGRRWDGFHVSIRDRIPIFQEKWIQEGLVFHSTKDIIKSVCDVNSKIHGFNGLMLTVHPQRWTNQKIEWVKELANQSVKNNVKRMFVK